MEKRKNCHNKKLKQIQEKGKQSLGKGGRDPESGENKPRKETTDLRKNLDLGEKGEAREMGELSLKEEKQAQEGKRQDQKKEKLTPKVEEAAEEKTQLVREK